VYRHGFFRVVFGYNGLLTTHVWWLVVFFYYGWRIFTSKKNWVGGLPRKIKKRKFVVSELPWHGWLII